MNENRMKDIMKASVVAIIVNAALGVFKAFVGMITNSIAITMDAINNFTDAGSSLITILGTYFAAKDQDKKQMRFDAVISFDAKSRRQVYEQVVERVKEKYPDYTLVVGMDSDFNEIDA